MRILLSCQQSGKRHAIPAYGFWRTYFVQGLQEAGHEVLEVPGVDWAEGLTHPAGADLDAWRARTWDRTLGYVRREMQIRPIDLCITYLFPPQVDVPAIGELQRIGIPCVNFFCDSVRDFRKAPPEFRPFALHWLPDIEGLPVYRAAGLPHMHAPYPCWVAPELRNIPAAETEPPTFIGSVDVLRRALLGRAIELGADMIVRGTGWDSGEQNPPQPQAPHSLRRMITNQLALLRHAGPGAIYFKLQHRLRPMTMPPIPRTSVKAAVSDAEYFRISREAVVTIGVNRVPTLKASHRRPLRFTRLRDVEAPMLGACYLTEWTESVADMYELGSEVETYRTAEELSAKLAELRRNPQRRRSMRERAQRHALRDHSLGRSIARIAARLGLSAGA